MVWNCQSVRRLVMKQDWGRWWSFICSLHLNVLLPVLAAYDEPPHCGTHVVHRLDAAFIKDRCPFLPRFDVEASEKHCTVLACSLKYLFLVCREVLL